MQINDNLIISENRHNNMIHKWQQLCQSIGLDKGDRILKIIKRTNDEEYEAFINYKPIMDKIFIKYDRKLDRKLKRKIRNIKLYGSSFHGGVNNLMGVKFFNIKSINLSKYTNLTTLCLYNIEDVVFPPKMKNVKTLRLVNCNKINTLDDINLTDNIVCGIWGNYNINNDYICIPELSDNLQHIQVTSSKVQSVDCTRYENLRSIRMHYIDNVKLPHIINNLETLECNSCKNTIIDLDYCKYNSLTTISLDNINELRSLPKCLKNVKTLRILNCHFNNNEKQRYYTINVEGLSHKLEYIYLCHCNVYELDVTKCYNLKDAIINDVSILKFPNNFSELRTLSLIECDNITFNDEESSDDEDSINEYKINDECRNGNYVDFNKINTENIGDTNDTSCIDNEENVSCINDINDTSCIDNNTDINNTSCIDDNIDNNTNENNTTLNKKINNIQYCDYQISNDNFKYDSPNKTILNNEIDVIESPNTRSIKFTDKMNKLKKLMLVRINKHNINLILPQQANSLRELFIKDYNIECHDTNVLNNYTKLTSLTIIYTNNGTNYLSSIKLPESNILLKQLRLDNIIVCNNVSYKHIGDLNLNNVKFMYEDVIISDKDEYESLVDIIDNVL